jgi:hypothetical protein
LALSTGITHELSTHTAPTSAITTEDRRPLVSAARHCPRVRRNVKQLFFKNMFRGKEVLR